MRDLLIRERADHVRHGVDSPDVGEKAVAQPLAAAGSLGQTGDVDYVDRGVDLLGGLEHLVKTVEARVGHGHDAHVGLGRRISVGRGGGVGVRERVEESGLAHVGQADDAELHECVSSLAVSRVSSRREAALSWRRTRPG